MIYMSGSTSVVVQSHKNRTRWYGPMRKCSWMMKDAGDLNSSQLCAESGFFARYRGATWSEATCSATSVQRWEEMKRKYDSYGECLALGIYSQMVIYSVDADWSCQDQKVKNDFGTQNVLSNRESRHHRAINQSCRAESDFNNRV